MELGDEVNELALLSSFGTGGDGDVDFVDALGFAEISEGLRRVRSGEDGRTLPDPEAVDQGGRRLRESRQRGRGE
jgi:hypothetical protein